MSMAAQADIKERMNGQTLILEIPETIHQEALQRIASSMAERGIHEVLVILTAVTFIESSGLGALVAAYKSFKDVGVTMGITGIQPYVQKLIGLTKLDRILKIFPTEEEALLGFASAQ
jgi:anti-anti-sigma factor